MRLQIDTVKKTISVEDDVKLSELIKVLNAMFPKEEWKDYELSSKVVIKDYAGYPVYVHKYTPSIPWRNSPIICLSDSSKKFGNALDTEYYIKEGIFNVKY